MILNSGITNIQRIGSFAASTPYVKFDIVYFTGNPDENTTAAQNPSFEESGHYYCVSSHTSESATSSAVSSPTGSSTQWTQDFIAEPSYGAKMDFKAATYNINMGDGYYSPLNKNINSLRIMMNLSFRGRDDRETKAIAHIIEDSFNRGDAPSGGYSGITWTPPAPYNKTRPFYVEEFNHDFVYPNVNNISFTFKNETASLTEWQGLFTPFSGTRGFYESDETYISHDITYMSGALIDQSGWYYYSGSGGLSNHNSSPTGSTTQWTKENFYFETQENISLDRSPRFRRQDFQNEFFTRQKDGINLQLLTFSLAYNGLTDVESKAMVHFLESKRGNRQFLFTPPAPYDEQKVFISPNWSHIMDFKDNNTVTVNFVEHPIDYTAKANTFLTLATTIFTVEGNI